MSARAHSLKSRASRRSYSKSINNNNINILNTENEKKPRSVVCRIGGCFKVVCMLAVCFNQLRSSTQSVATVCLCGLDDGSKGFLGNARGGAYRTFM